ncbi:MAG: serine/threonine-protein kinase [Verrucomicrobiales bacterium]
MPATDDPSSQDDERFDSLFDQAMELPHAERAAFVRQACGDDAALRQQLEELIASEDVRTDFMDDPTVATEGDDTEADPIMGASIGSYKLLQRLGEGGYGVVYLAEQRAPVTRRVALKVIKLGMDTKQVVARFEAERQALAMMEHPNIAKVFDAGATDAGRPYFVMELVRGLPITAYCDQVKLPVAERLKLFVKVCQAVQHAHQKGIIHRDLKPNNILVTLHDGVPVPKVIDFGIAKATNFRLTEHTLFTDFRQFVGTPVYTSPEQMEMSGFDVDTRSDLYSLGVLLYELLTGTTPVLVESLKAAAYGEIQRTILETEPPTPSRRVSSLANARQVEVAEARAGSPSKLRQLLRGDLDWILIKALEKDRERRYESATAFGQDVQRFLDGEPVSAGAPSPLYRLRRFASRHKAAVAVMLALLAGGLVSFWQAIRASRGEMEARRNLYIADMSVAHNAWNAGNKERAITVLERHFPKPGERDLRHWEWRYLWGQTHREMFSLFADDDPDDDIHHDGVSEVAMSRDGKLLGSAGRNGNIRIWDMESRSERFQFQVHHGFVTWVDFSPNSQLVLGGFTKHGGDPAEPELVVWSVPERRKFPVFDRALDVDMADKMSSMYSAFVPFF